MSEQLTLDQALDKDLLVLRAEAQAELKKHGQSLLSYFADYPDEMYGANKSTLDYEEQIARHQAEKSFRLSALWQRAKSAAGHILKREDL